MRWSRRRFLAVSGGAAAQAAAGLKGLGQAGSAAARAASAVKANAAEAAAQMPPPGVITGGIRPLMKGMTARPLRYTPVAAEFVIRNGKEFFNRPLYGVSSPTQSGDFRVDAGDLPEFSMYLPGHGGNLKLGFIAAAGKASKWGADADEVIARYRPGRMIYEIRDALMGNGTMRVEVVTTGEGSGYMVKVEGINVPRGSRLAWAFAGVSGRKGQRNGDIGCEKQPVSEFFEVRAEECDSNAFQIEPVLGHRWVRVISPHADLGISLPVDSQVAVISFDEWMKAPAVGRVANASAGPRPILTGSVEMKPEPMYLTIAQSTAKNADSRGAVVFASADISGVFAKRSAVVDAIAQTVQADTPDEFLNAAAGNFGIAAETIWDQKNQCVLHGGVAWRTMLAGWRGPYNLDALGNHDRAMQEIRHWLKKQNVTAVTTGDPAIGPWDANIHDARKEGMLHTNGDVSNNHYDMNMVFIDMTLRHLMWTGDLEFAKEIYPALELHLAWEHRLFRRTFTSAAGKELPLYEAYAAIWASDNLQYNGGGAAHSSAYNIFAFRAAAKIAKALGGDGEPYTREAELLHEGMQELLWVKSQGAYGESKDLMEPQVVYKNPALWTVYHTIDSEVPTRRQSWQMVAERLAALRHVPVHGAGVPDEGLYMLSCSDWLPYMWSLNLLLMAENAHMALAMWQTGMRDEAYRVYKGALLDSMYMGLCPGDFHMTSALDVHRQEAQRDFGDPLGTSSRALVEGLFGVQPDLIAGEVRWQPGFPSAWNHASLKHKDFDLAWKREGMKDMYSFDSRLAQVVPLKMRVPARTTRLPVVTIGGVRVPCAFDAEAVGGPMLVIEAPASRTTAITIKWHGRAPTKAPGQRSYRTRDRFGVPAHVGIEQIDDPQSALVDGRVVAAGFHTVFANVHEGECAWTMPISFEAKDRETTFLGVPQLAAGMHAEPVDLTLVMKSSVTEIFARVYLEPRSQYCSLAVPDNLLGGWANPDGRATIDDTGLRAAGGLLKTAVGVDFATPAGSAPNCAFVSCWKQDDTAVKVALNRRAHGIYLLMAGSTLPQCSRMVHGTVSVTYTDGTQSKLKLRNPETWWPIEQDYLLDDYLFVDDAPLPPRVDLRTGQTRMLDPVSFHGNGRSVPGGAATILHLPLDSAKELGSLEVRAELYGVVIGLLGATLVRG